MNTIIKTWLTWSTTASLTAHPRHTMDELFVGASIWSDRSVRKAIQVLTPAPVLVEDIAHFANGDSEPNELPTPTDVPIPESWDVPVPEPIDVRPPTPRDVPPPEPQKPTPAPKPRPIP